MNLHNLNSTHLTKEQVTKAFELLDSLETALNPLQANLTPEDRHRYGRVNEQNKLFINKVKDYLDAEPNLKSPDVNWEEFAKDYKSREVLEKILNRLNSLATRVNNSKILHDYDNYQDALEDYAYTSFRARSQAVGYEDKYKDCKQFFTKSRKKNDTEEV